MNAAIKSERLAILQDRLETGQRAFNQACVDRVLPVLFTGPGRHGGQLVGRSPYMQPVHAELPPSMIGALADIRIVAGHANSLAGESVEEERRRACA